MENLFLELETIAAEIQTLCPWDDHNELKRLNELKAKTQKKINELFNL